MMAAPALMPAHPLGAKPPVAGLLQFSGLIRNTPTAMKNRMSPTLSSTIALLVLADSRIPTTSTQVIASTTRKAGRLAMNGTPKTCGALSSAEARYSTPGSEAPSATARAASDAERTSVASQAGSVIPRCPSSSRKWPDQPIATPMLPTAYSTIRSHPMIQATNSPSEA